MSHEILINVTPRETRVAVVENGALEELHVERARRQGVVGNIYHGRITRVVPGMQAAFVEAGLDRAAFLHASDAGSGERLVQGTELTVQVLKDPLGTKGARLTTEVSLPSRFLVFMPHGGGVGCSTRIEDEAERERLRALVLELADPGIAGGYIVRTAGEGATRDALRADMTYLQRLWERVRDYSADATVGQLVHAEPPLHLRMVRDLMGVTVERLLIDSREAYLAAREFAEAFVPELAQRIEHYPGERPLLEMYGIEAEIQRALERRVELKSGGYLVIDQTEAMTTIDVNSGGFVGARSLEDTSYKTNLEAAHAVARQLRLRNLGGIIIIDFIDMLEERHRKHVLDTLQAHLARDHARPRISGISALGLVEMTRRRTRESLARVLCEPCTACSGRGVVKSAETVCYEIFRELIRAARQYQPARMTVLAAPTVIDLLLDDESTGFAEACAFIGKPVALRADPAFLQDQFEVVPG